MITRAQNENDGTQIKFEGATLVSKNVSGAPQGTVITVENLFSTCQRGSSFLKSEVSERGHISNLITRYAMAYPHVRFRLNFDNRNVFQSSGNGDLREVMINVYGVDIARQMIELTTDPLDFPPPPVADADDSDEWLQSPARKTKLPISNF